MWFLLSKYYSQWVLFTEYYSQCTSNVLTVSNVHLPLLTVRNVHWVLLTASIVHWALLTVMFTEKLKVSIVHWLLYSPYWKIFFRFLIECGHATPYHFWCHKSRGLLVTTYVLSSIHIQVEFFYVPLDICNFILFSFSFQRKYKIFSSTDLWTLFSVITHTMTEGVLVWPNKSFKTRL